MVELQPSKLIVAGSSPVSRSTFFYLDLKRYLKRTETCSGYFSRCSSGVERFLGKEEVTGSNPVIGSGLINLRRAEKLK